jgi:superfamily II DNA or RNA helicase
MPLWKHQERAISQLREAIDAGHRRIVVVGPTGSGKGTLATEILRLATQQGNKGLFLVHRREIVLDVAQRLRNVNVRVGVILPGHNSSPYADVQVASVDTLKNRDVLPTAHVVVVDECHHYSSNKWSRLIDAYSNAIVVGMTATPERADGKALSQFQHMIVAAQYSELIREGLICQARVYQPTEAKGSDLATDPVLAYQTYAPGTKGFCFVSTLDLGRDVAKRFCDIGVPAVCITGTTAKSTRDAAVRDLKSGAIRILVNYGVFCEGTDIPDAELCILARRAAHCGTYLQICGRVLRAHSSKRMAIILDLSGSSLANGLPTADREYSLGGKSGYNLAALAPLCVCPACGLTQLAGKAQCEGCSFTFIRKARTRPTIFSEQLKLVFDFENTPESAKLDEYLRLLDLSLTRGYSIDFVVSSYYSTFSSKVPATWLNELPIERRRREFLHWKSYGESRGYRPGYAYMRYKETFGSAPSF